MDIVKMAAFAINSEYVSAELKLLEDVNRLTDDCSDEGIAELVYYALGSFGTATKEHDMQRALSVLLHEFGCDTGRRGYDVSVIGNVAGFVGNWLLDDGYALVDFDDSTGTYVVKFDADGASQDPAMYLNAARKYCAFYDELERVMELGLEEARSSPVYQAWLNGMKHQEALPDEEPAQKED